MHKMYSTKKLAKTTVATEEFVEFLENLLAENDYMLKNSNARTDSFNKALNKWLAEIDIYTFLIACRSQVRQVRQRGGLARGRPANRVDLSAYKKKQNPGGNAES